MVIEETSLMELVNRPRHSKPYEPVQLQSGTDLDSSSTNIKDKEGSSESDDESEDLAEKITFLREFWKQVAISATCTLISTVCIQ